MVKHLSKKLIYLISLAVLLGGLLISFQWQQTVKTNHLSELEVYFNQYTSKAYLALQQALVREMERLDSLAAAFKLTDTMSYQDFVRFSKVVTVSSEQVHSLQWIKVINKRELPQIKSEMLAQGFNRFEVKTQPNEAGNQLAVIKYIYPLLANNDKLATDIYSNEATREAAYIADITQSPISVAPNSLYSEGSVKPLVTVFQPIYDASGTLRGYVAMTLDMVALIDYISSKNLLEKSLHWFIRDNYSKQTLYGTKPNAETSQPTNFFRTHDFFVPFSGRSWSLNLSGRLDDLPEFNQKRFNDFLNSGLIGVALSLVLSLLMYFILMLKFRSYQAEKEIRENEKQYQQLVKQSSEGFLLLNREGYILDVNAETCTMLGYEKPQLMQKHLSDIDVDNDFFQAKRLCFSIMPQDKLLFETTFQKKRGTRITVEVSASRITMGGKEVIGAFVRDLTERLTYRALSVDNKQLQEALEQHTQELSAQKNTFEALFKKSSDGVFIFSGKQLMDCNQAGLEMFSFRNKDKLFNTNPSYLMPRYQPDGERSIRKALRMLEICMMQGRHRFEWLAKRSSGEEFWCDIVITQIEYYAKPVIHMAIRDISLRKRLELQMEHARAEAVYANQVKSEFMAKMSHEIRTPLHGILNYARMGEERIGSVDETKLKRYYSNIKVSAERLLVLFNDLLDSAKLDHGSMSYDFKYQNLLPVVENCVAEQQVAIKNKQIQVDLLQLDYMAYFDKHRIEQVISNLLSNAIRYTPKDEHIVIQVEFQEGSHITVSVRDSGPGVDANQLEHIFDSFVHDQNQALSSDSSGLGLAICREIVQAHKGSIWVENWQLDENVQGAIFKFTLPLSMQIKDDTIN